MLDMNLLNKFDLVVWNNLSKNTKEYVFSLEQGASITIEVDMNECTHVLEMTLLLLGCGINYNDKYPCLAKLSKYCIIANSDILIWKNIPNSLVEEFLKEILEKNN